MENRRSISKIRKEFLDFFEEKGHTIVSSASLVPLDDPTLLFINSGMAQFKDIFLGEELGSFVRAADTQKCLRVSGKHNDLEEVGHDTYHHTFFEMLGNWSFGDYFKKEAIDLAWELLVERWGLPADRLYATVHAGDAELGLPSDKEAADLWKRYLPKEHVLYGSSKDNFWMMGETGPCGPCSEIHIDLRSEEERDQLPGSECVNKDLHTVIELWNLVFIQYDAQADHGLVPLAERHVDTGMGLERLAAILQGKVSTYDTDAFSELLNEVARLTPIVGIRAYDDIDPALDSDSIRVAMRVIVDHIRAIAVAIADGVTPGNVGRGYVIRRILRRAVRYGYTTLNLKEPFLCRLVPTVIKSLGEVSPNLGEKSAFITESIRGEERAFLRTLGRGLKLFDSVCKYIGKLSSSDWENSIEGLQEDVFIQDLLRKAYAADTDSLQSFIAIARLSRIPGEIAFLLHDTYGFPVDLTQLMAREHGFHVDMPRFEELMAEQKHRARSAKATDKYYLEASLTHSGTSTVRAELSNKPVRTAFIGYEVTTLEGARVVGSDKNAGFIVLDRTPFYAESGGQVGDTGTLNFDGEVIRVIDTQVLQNQILHKVERFPSSLECKVTASVNQERRRRIAKHHTATHLMHAALRETLGPGVEQKGSLVAPGHLRFDFSHYERVSPEDLRRVQNRVNEQVQRNIIAEIEDNVPYKEALARGATALFGEKYGDFVRMVTFDPDFSVELCGGTHVGATGEIGLFLLQSEGSVAAGIRRVEAITGVDAVNLVTQEREMLTRATRQFKGSKRPIEESVAELLETNRSLQKELEQLRHASLVAQVDGLVENVSVLNGVNVVAGRIDDTDMAMLRSQGQELRLRLGPSSVGVLGTCDPRGQKAYLVAVVTDDLVPKGVKAGAIVNQLARQIGGGGGGKPDFATAGGRKPEKLDAVLQNVHELIRNMLPAPELA
ncbi:MAG: alanine--tRNA ligase [Bacteroidota bacterium]|nr:alanine--tRNA ligase [Bacteroidota bacterium]